MNAIENTKQKCNIHIASYRVYHVTRWFVDFRGTIIIMYIVIPYSGKFSERNIFGNLIETVVSEIKFRNVATCYYIATELL